MNILKLNKGEEMRWIKREDKEPEWRSWFAWKPVPVGEDGRGGRFPADEGDIMVWLEFVERRERVTQVYSYTDSCQYEYRLPQGGK